MRRSSVTYAVLVVTLLLTGAVAAAQEAELAAAPRISMAEFRQIAATGKVVVIDTRPPETFAQGRIPGAVNLPLASILAPQRVAQLKTEGRPIVVYCAWVAEHTSARAVLELAKVGVKARALTGGWNVWVAEGGKIEK